MTDIDYTQVRWDCPKCNKNNLDDYLNTATPVCWNCDTTVEWSAFLTDTEFTELNARTPIN